VVGHEARVHRRVTLPIRALVPLDRRSAAKPHWPLPSRVRMIGFAPALIITSEAVPAGSLTELQHPHERAPKGRQTAPLNTGRIKYR